MSSATLCSRRQPALHGIPSARMLPGNLVRCLSLSFSSLPHAFDFRRIEGATHAAVYRPTGPQNRARSFGLRSVRVGLGECLALVGLCLYLHAVSQFRCHAVTVPFSALSAWCFWFLFIRSRECHMPHLTMQRRTPVLLLPSCSMNPRTGARRLQAVTTRALEPVEVQPAQVAAAAPGCDPTDRRTWPGRPVTVSLSCSHCRLR